MNATFYLFFFPEIGDEGTVPVPVAVIEVNAILEGPTSRTLTLRSGFQRVLELPGPTSEVITVEG